MSALPISGARKERAGAMGLTELTPAQQATVDALVVARRLERVPIDADRCTSFLEQARVALADLPNVTHAQNRHNLGQVSVTPG